MSDDSDHEVYDSSDGSTHTRERWTGPPRTWLKYTEEERGLISSLNQTQDADLSLHLYNAHALRLRSEEYERIGPKARVHQEHPDVPEVERTFAPPRHWTAWPLPPEQVPRAAGKINSLDYEEQVTFRRETPQWPSLELEEVLEGITLKFAKERFLDRDSDEDDIDEHNLAAQQMDHKIKDRKARASSQSTATSSEPLIPQAPLRAVVMADDDAAAALLVPSVRMIISRLDSLLVALHHARQATQRHSKYEESDSEAENIASETTSPKRRQGRPLDANVFPFHLKAAEGSLPQDGITSGSVTPEPKKRGRKRKIYPRLDGETDQEFAIRIARQQKKPLPVFDSHSTGPSSPGIRPPTSRSASRRRTSNSRVRLGLRDWSEVIGAAALVGCPTKVVNRAAQRCASLFDQGMEIRNSLMMPFADHITDDITRYVPDPIPDYDGDSRHHEAESHAESSTAASEDDIAISCQRPGLESSFQGVDREVRSLHCSIVRCPRRTEGSGFADIQRLRKHLHTEHSISLENIDDYVVPSDEEMDGALHVDGFLQPIKGPIKHMEKRDFRSKKHTGGPSRVEEGSLEETSNMEADFESDEVPP